MSNIALNARNQNWGRWIKNSWYENKPLALTVIFSVSLLIVALTGLIVDSRMLLGEPLWLKPTKFAISGALYAGTLLWLMQFVEGYERMVKTVSWITAGVMMMELTLIAIQASRGVRSHFNGTGAFDIAVYSTMGTAILILWLASVVALVYLIRQDFHNSAWGLALKLGLTIGVIGSGLGGLMTMPTAEQMTVLESGNQPAEIGAHSVGVADGTGEKLPIVGWSNSGGDLRVGHFIGMHAMQVMPLIGYAILRQNRHLSRKQQKRLIWTAGLTYLGVVIIVTWQALRAEPFIAPGGLTLIAWIGLLAASAGACTYILQQESNR